METLALILWLTIQTPYAAAGSAQTYAPPTVRPFEPTETFAQSAPAGSTERSQPLTQPETLDAFRRGYQVGPEPLDAAYEQGVATAEAQADALAGPLDGGWLVMDGDRARGRMVLADVVGGIIEGAFSPVEGGGAATPLTGRREGDRAELSLEGRSVRLRRTDDGWSGTWGEARVTLRRGL
ncbi:MAG: hypothetical protein J0M36_11380 [Caulobacterales bacterium]|nr:hypothetical protein [Caulobacterales bacterium]